MELQEITSNTIKVICSTLIESIHNLSNAKNLDEFHAAYGPYNQAWVDWDKLMRLLEIGKESEYKAYAYSLMNMIKTNTKINAVSFDPEVDTLEKFYAEQQKHMDFSDFSPNEIIAWDENYFMVNDFFSSSIIILNRPDKIKK